MSVSRNIAAAVCLLALAAIGRAQAPAAMAYKPAASTTFMHHPALPACTQIAVQEGDPTKGGSTILMKIAAACVVPWHWHTPNERLIIISGTGKGEVRMKDMKPLTLKAGDYVVLPAKGIHQFTAITPVTLFDISDAAFDIHYVDDAGKEIPLDQAVKAKPKK